MSVEKNYQATMGNIPEERRFNLHRGGNLKSCKLSFTQRLQIIYHQIFPPKNLAIFRSTLHNVRSYQSASTHCKGKKSKVQQLPRKLNKTVVEVTTYTIPKLRAPTLFTVKQLTGEMLYSTYRWWVNAWFRLSGVSSVAWRFFSVSKYIAVTIFRANLVEGDATFVCLYVCVCMCVCVCIHHIYVIPRLTSDHANEFFG